MRRPARTVCALLAWLIGTASVVAVTGVQAAPLALTPLVTGVSTFISNALVFIAIEEGHFAASGIEIRQVVIRSDIEAWPALIAGQMDVNAGGFNAGLIEAIRRGARLRIVADKWHLGPADRTLALMVRQELIDSGRFRTLPDLQGLRVAAGIRGGVNERFWDRLLRDRAFLTREHVTFIQVPQAFVADALRAKVVDAALTGEPYVTRLENLGVAKVVVTGDEILPRAQLGAITYGPNLLSRNRGLGQRFMNAYLRGVRQYNAGKTERNLAIIRRFTGEDEALLRQMQWPFIHADGHLNVESIAAFQAWWVREGLLPQTLPPEQVVDLAFIRRAAIDLAKPK